MKSGTLKSNTTKELITTAFVAKRNGLKTNTIKVKAAAKVIPAKFVNNNKVAPKNMGQFNQPKPIAATAKGGTKATAIATPAKVFATSSRACA